MIMKLLLFFAFLALVCMARSAPPPTTPRLLLPDYQDADQDVPVDDTNNNDDEDQDTDEDPEEDTTTTTTTTTTTRRSPHIPTRNRHVIPTRRPFLTSRFTPRTTTTTTAAADDEDDENTDSSDKYNGDFQYIRDFRVYVQKLLEDIRKLVRNLTGYDFMNNQARQQQNYPTRNDGYH